MIKVAELVSQRTLILPVEVASRFRPSDHFVVWVEGSDTLHLKRITPSPITDIVAQAPAGEPLSLDAINEIVHEVRYRRQAVGRR